MWISTGRGKLSGLLEEKRWPFILSGQTFSGSTDIEGIILVAGEEVEEVTRGASDMGVGRIG